MIGSSHPEVFCKECVFKNFTKFTGKHLYQSLLFNKVAGLSLNDIATNQMRIHIALKICNTRSTWFFLSLITLHWFPPHVTQHWHFLDKLNYLTLLWSRYTYNSTKLTLKFSFKLLRFPAHPKPLSLIHFVTKFFNFFAAFLGFLVSFAFSYTVYSASFL